MKETMNVLNTKDEVLEYLTNLTANYKGVNDLERFTAQYIGLELNISRNLASQYLNELVKEELVFKIVSRPVYFIHKKTFEQKNHMEIEDVIFDSLNEFKEFVEEKEGSRKVFSKVIGYDASLSYCVEQSKAGIGYPPHGLPLLFYGENGTGKNNFVRTLFEYAKKNNLVSDKSKLMIIDCINYESKESDFEQKLHIDSEVNWFTKSLGGILYFENIQYLSQKSILDIFHYMDKLKKKEDIGIPKLVMSRNKNPNTLMDKNVLRRIPINIYFPNLEERSLKEKRDFFFQFLKEEENRMEMEIEISHQVLNAFINHKFIGNLSQMKKDIQITCAKAFLRNENNGNKLRVRLYDLPEELFFEFQAENKVVDGKEEFIDIENVLISEKEDRGIKFLENLINLKKQWKNEGKNFSFLLELWEDELYKYGDYLIFDCKYTHTKIEGISQIVEQIFYLVSQKYNIEIPMNGVYMVSREIYNTTQIDTNVYKWEKENIKEIEKCINLIERNLLESFTIAEETTLLLEQNLNICVSKISFFIMALYIHQTNPNVFINDTSAIVVSHGYATASSITHTANQLIKKNILVPFDMPLSVPLSEIVMKIKMFLDNNKFIKNLIVLVDMGSLEELDKGLSDTNNVNIGILNNITTKIAVEVGFGIINSEPMETILKRVCEQSKCQYKIVINNKDLKDTIIFNSKVGSGIAHRMVQLFEDSLPRKIDIEILSYDFSRMENDEDDYSDLDDRNILFISGIFNPNIPDVPFIPIEDFIGLMEQKHIRGIFSQYFSEEELEELSQNLLKNFSLINIVKNLTILDADRLLNFVEDGLNKLQRSLGIQFNANTIVGLYIHISCLIERLVTKTPVESYEDINKFLVDQESFVQKVRKSFGKICEHYNVEIPDSEIGYIYDYIYGARANDISQDEF